VESASFNDVDKPQKSGRLFRGLEMRPWTGFPGFVAKCSPPENSRLRFDRVCRLAFRIPATKAGIDNSDDAFNVLPVDNFTIR
jgi:hypothetical protein